MGKLNQIIQAVRVVALMERMRGAGIASVRLMTVPARVETGAETPPAPGGQR
ncbi:MAG: hypothetical protein AAFV33_20575 [Chloroflexota bacterium]